MSWKGFVKGATRLPHTIASKTGYAQTTKHGEFEELHESFKLMESLTIKLHEDAIIFKVHSTREPTFSHFSCLLLDLEYCYFVCVFFLRFYEKVG